MTTPDKKKNNYSRSALIVGIFTLLTVGSWVIFDVYRSLVKTTLTPSVQKEIQPLDSQLDADVMNDLKTRRQFTNQELTTVHPNPNLVISPTASGSGIVKVIPTPVASESTQSATGRL